MKKLSILYVVTSFPSVTETFIATQVAEMINKGHDCTIFSFNKSIHQINHKLNFDYQLSEITVTHFKNSKNKLLLLKNVFLFFLKFHKKIKYRLFFSLLNPFKFSENKDFRDAYWNFPIFLLSNKYDCIHCHFGYNGLKVARLKKLGILDNENCIVSFHGSDLIPSKLDKYKEMYQDLFYYFDSFTVNTIYLESILKKILPPEKKSYIIPVGFNEKYLMPFLDLIKYEKFTIVFCGRLIPLKGPENALRILAELIHTKKRDVQLLMIGDGVELNNLKKLSIELNIESHIVWYGELNQEKVFELMSKSHVFLYPGITDKETLRAETQGLVIQEAQYLKLPVIVSNVGGVKYGLIDEKTGYLLNPDDLSIFVDKIIEFIDLPDKRLSMGLMGHKFVSKKYNISALNNNLLSVYNSLD